jgi:hypothetical protein
MEHKKRAEQRVREIAYILVFVAIGAAVGIILLKRRSFR